jgi:antitoxin component YwqK of YwqJK toxin-antitoxin module
MNTPNNNNTYFSFKRFIIDYIIIGVFVFCGSGSVFGQEIDPNGRNVFYFQNGRISSEGYFKNGLPVGIWKSYYSDGTLKSSGNKSKGLSDSLWVFFDSEGRKKHLFDYANDKKNGCAVYYDTSGNVVKEMFYLNDVAQQEILEYYPGGALKKQTTIIDGKAIGLALEFNEQGDVITEEIYDNGFLKDRKEFNRLDENGKKTGIWRSFFSNGNLESEVTYKDGNKSGLSKTYNKKGKLIDLQRMEGDTIAGHSDELVIIELYKEFYDNGKIKLIGGLDNGIKNGTFREYNEGGEIVNGYIYESDTVIAEGVITGNGVYEGEWIHYYKSGAIKAKGNYVNSKKEGKWIYYYANGKKEQEGNFTDNQLKGSWIWYYQNGQVKRKEFYNRKELLEGTVFEYDSLGNEMTRGDYYNGLKEGEWFYHVGDHKEVGEYTLGFETGKWNHYYQNGKLAFTGTYDEGEPKGKHIYYHKNGLKKLVGKYLGGEKHGKWKAYDQKGVLIQEIEYKRGEIFKIDGFKVTPVNEEI